MQRALIGALLVMSLGGGALGGGALGGGALFQIEGPLRALRQAEPSGSSVDLRMQASPIVWIPAGEFVMGASEADVRYAMSLCQEIREGLSLDACGPRRFDFEVPARRVWTEAYGIDRLEVSQGEYQRCVIAGRCRPSTIGGSDRRISAPELPVVGLELEDAEAYCRFVNGRLPSEQEWERAARGNSGRRRFPWGRLYNPNLANHGRPPLRPDASDGFRYAAPVRSYASGRSAYGLLNMAGNVWEWTASPPSAEQLSFLTDPESYRVIRGGSYHHSPLYLRVSAKNFLPRGEARGDVGMRCAYDPPRAAR